MATSCLKDFPSFKSSTSFCLSLVIVPELLTNLIEFSLKNKSLHTWVGEPKSNVLLAPGIIDPVTPNPSNNNALADS